MAIRDITRKAVLAATSEYDELGQDEFLDRYKFGRARKYVLVLDGKTYDSKAIVGAAHRHATGEALPAAAFSGGLQTVVAWLTALGFEVRDTTVPAARGSVSELADAEQSTSRPTPKA